MRIGKVKFIKAGETEKMNVMMSPIAMFL